MNEPAFLAASRQMQEHYSGMDTHWLAFGRAYVEAYLAALPTPRPTVTVDAEAMRQSVETTIREELAGHVLAWPNTTEPRP